MKERHMFCSEAHFCLKGSRCQVLCVVPWQEGRIHKFLKLDKLSWNSTGSKCWMDHLHYMGVSKKRGKTPKMDGL